MKHYQLLMIFPLLCTIVMADPAIIWQEDFARYADGEHPAAYHNGTGVVLSEGAQKFYRCPSGLMGGFEYFGSRHWERYDLRFKLRFQERATLYLVVKSGGWRGESPYTWYYVTINANSVAPVASGLPAEVPHTVPATVIDPPLATNVWYTFDVAVAASNVTVRAQGPNEPESRLLWDHAVLPGGGGINFHGIPSYDLAEIIVTEP